MTDPIPISSLSIEPNAYIRGFTQEGENMRCPFLASNYECNQKLYHDISDLQLHLFEDHAIGLHEISEDCKMMTGKEREKYSCPQSSAAGLAEV